MRDEPHVKKMIEAEGVVVKVEGDVAYIQAQRASSCGGCAQQGGSCGSATLIGFFGRKTPWYSARNPVGAKVGERVVVGIEELALFKGVLAIYVPPLLLLVAGAIAGHRLAVAPAAADGYAMLGALLGVVAGYFGSRYAAARLAAGEGNQPVVLNRLGEANVVNYYGES